MEDLSTIEMLDRLIQKFGPVETARKLGVSYMSIWRWATKKCAVSPLGSSAIHLLWERENG